MSETMRFRIARGPQRAEPARSAVLRLFGHDLDPDRLFSRPGGEPVDGGDHAGHAVIAAANGWIGDGSCFAHPDRSRTPHEPGEPATPHPFTAVIDFVRRLDERIAAQAGDLDPDGLRKASVRFAAPLVDDD
ncbi:hypothetical protein OHA72_39495 [Dactylosporangium sp. NBC_01737]|uniref:hypothetical protein n=1 Tax=Dactylosporangium sp. NBC_01737 TaxID=2975959 RepID=UPI002E134C68|nr:hypothetical protein OHA72_39495 [Dactylosporangium sp. NBC_01737]